MYKKMLEDWFDSHMSEILASLNEIVSIESVADEQSSHQPFGEGSEKALKWGADFMESIGMTVENCDNYAVHGDFFADKKPELAVLSHLDVVPAAGGWSYPPFALTQKDGFLYGRGVIDDKGPSVAVLYACKAIKELNIPVKKNFRIIFGGDEEGGCKDMEYYSARHPFPERVFTPDGSFPVLNCEKGMIHLTFSAPFEDSVIAEISGGTVINAIPDKCTVTLKNSSDKKEVVYMGKSAHGSRPENGENAVTKFLYEQNSENVLLNNLKKLFPHGEFNGKSCGLGFSDKISGEMTCALTMLRTENGRLCGGIDIRFPIDRTLDEIRAIICENLNKSGFEIDDAEGMEPHYVDENSEFVQTLLNVYEQVKGEKGYCIAEGGITYVHNTKGGVAFGAEFPDENNNMHGADEHISMETFKLNLNMYANAIIACTM